MANPKQRQGEVVLVVLIVIAAVVVLVAALAAGLGGGFGAGRPTVVRRTIIRRPTRRTRVYEDDATL
jgi:hypothetical protein